MSWRIKESPQKKAVAICIVTSRRTIYSCLGVINIDSKTRPMVLKVKFIASFLESPRSECSRGSLCAPGRAPIPLP